MLTHVLAGISFLFQFFCFLLNSSSEDIAQPQSSLYVVTSLQPPTFPLVDIPPPSLSASPVKIISPFSYSWSTTISSLTSLLQNPSQTIEKPSCKAAGPNPYLLESRYRFGDLSSRPVLVACCLSQVLPKNRAGKYEPPAMRFRVPSSFLTRPEAKRCCPGLLMCCQSDHAASQVFLLSGGIFHLRSC